MTYEFSLVLGAADFTMRSVDALYEAALDDGTISTSQRITVIDVCREAISLESAICSAIGQVNAVGLSVARVEIEANQITPQSLP